MAVVSQAPVPVDASFGSPANRNWAFVIGVSNYTHLIPCPLSASDAAAAAVALELAGFQGAACLNPSKERLGRAMLTFCRRMADAASRGAPVDSVVLFFSGHCVSVADSKGAQITCVAPCGVSADSTMEGKVFT